MKYLLIGNRFDVAGNDEQSKQNECPRHVWATMVERWDMQVVRPGDEAKSSLLDLFRIRISSKREQWEAARSLADRLTDEDIVYCTGEDVAIPLSACCRKRKLKTQLVVFGHNLDRPRAKAAFALWGTGKTVWRWVVNAKLQFEYLSETATGEVFFLDEPVDTKFFTPSEEDNPKEASSDDETSTKENKPTIASVGLECRDYHTLAEATKSLGANVRVSGFSRDVKALIQMFPDPMPSYMERSFYPWDDLVNLYRQADVVVVPVLPCKFGAGLTSLLEAWACRRPAVVTGTEGLSPLVNHEVDALVVPPGDVAAMQASIERLLSDRDLAGRLAEAGYQRVLARHSQDRWVDAVGRIIEGQNDQPGKAYPTEGTA